MNETPELQLLVIDLGDSCVVKAEKGEIGEVLDSMLPPRWVIENSILFNKPFDEVRAAIDLDKPLPRIERNFKGTRLFTPQHPEGIVLPPDGYRSLCMLATADIPIWTDNPGEWTQLAGEGYPSAAFGETLPCSIWRYTR